MIREGQLVLADGGTIEFWVVPDWTSDPGYDPVIICNAGPEGASYLVAMLRDRDGIAIAAGEEEDVVTFDFSDGQLHHVAVVQYDDGTAVFVDGEVAGHKLEGRVPSGSPLRGAHPGRSR